MKLLENNLQAIQSKEVDDHAVEEERRIENEILEILRRRESIWKQRSRELWLAKGDRNTSFFHAATVVRKRRNQILVLMDDNGRPQENEAAKRDILNGFFKKLYTAGGVNVPCDLEGLITPSISVQENEMLLEIPSEEEIKLQVFQMHPLKAPGPDGFSGCFFRRCWEIVKSDVITFVQEFFRTGELSGNVNHTFLCLIPKGENPKTVDRFRPIALCNFVYKIISRIISQRLKMEIVHTIKKKKGRGGLMAIKIDMHKAYDRIEWPFLQRVLENHGFNDVVVKLIMKCVSSVSYSVLLNGKPQKKIHPGRGLRQGDPISPYLFVLCNDVLSRMLDRSQDKGDIHGIKISREAPAVTHLMFADDTLLFSRANTMEASIIGDCIKKFEGWSGQVCSKQKSGILFSSNCVKSMKENIEAQLGISTINDEEKYLGNPFVFSRRRKKDFDFIRSKLKQRLEGWKMRTLSYAGRMVAVSSIASAIPSYSMSTFQLPLSSCRELDALIRKFWWNGSLEKQRFLATISWDSLCRPKWSGGLGFRRMEDVNNALLSKLAWLLASGDKRPWAVALQARYFPRESFWSVQKKSGDSFIWRGILDARQVILQGSCMVIATGESINLWCQPWIPWLSYEDFRELMESIRCKAPSLLSVADLMYRREKKWNSNYLCFLFGEDLGMRISQIQIAQELGNDLLIWKEANRGVFSVKEAYLMGQKSRFGSIEPLWKWIWKENLHPRMRMILWRAIAGALPTGDKFGAMQLCCFCSKEMESPLHIFVQCPSAVAIWFGSPVPIRSSMVSTDSLKSFVIELCSGLEPEPRYRFLLCLAVIIDTLWFFRNECRHGKDPNPNIHDLLRIVWKKYGEFSQYEDNGEVVLQKERICSEVDYIGSQKRKLIMVDGSFSKGKIGAGFLAWNRDTNDWFYEAKSAVGENAVVAEVFAWFIALQWATNNNWDDLVIIPDSSVVVDAFMKEKHPNWHCISWFSSALKMKRSLSDVTMQHTNRTYLAFVDNLAKSARLSESDFPCCKGEGFPPVDPVFSVFNEV
uniref:Reverse transcriptase domain-containing protein n=1 Tax=Cannabis sativa TaxID=3483 RepID=A0A803Q980_CANSA